MLRTLLKAITCTVTIREVNIGRKTNVNLLPTLITAISLQILGSSNVLTSYFTDHGTRVVQRPRRVGLFEYCYQARHFSPKYGRESSFSPRSVQEKNL